MNRIEPTGNTCGNLLNFSWVAPISGARRCIHHDDESFWSCCTRTPPQNRFAKGQQNPASRTKLQIALSLVEQAQSGGITFRAIVADCFYCDNHALEAALLQRLAAPRALAGALLERLSPTRLPGPDSPR